MTTLAEVREAFLESLATVPFHRHLGIEVEVTGSGTAVALPARPEIVGPGGEHSPAAVYALGDAACSVHVCDEAAVRALELELGAIFFTVSSQTRRLGPARGRLTATSELLAGLAPGVGSPGSTRKGKVEVAARIYAEDGEQAAEQRMSFYVRFMEPDRVREMTPSSSAISRLHAL